VKAMSKDDEDPHKPDKDSEKRIIMEKAKKKKEKKS
jgi:hypothetical protein